ncbi:MAG: DUF2851 family protein [Chloroherpetonaceae bacterium]|nr:DUF2851 family protein [Chloroherpetonaceae bacterium]
MKIPEKYLRHIWKNQYFNRETLATTTGEKIQVLGTGKLNPNEGPDFIGAKLIIGTRQVEGDIEIHQRTSDWNRHRHSENPHYNNLILHAALHCDSNMPEGTPLLNLRDHLSQPFPLVISNCLRDESLLLAGEMLACNGLVEEVDDRLKMEWISFLSDSRFETKAESFNHHAQEMLEAAVYQGVARALGYSENAAPMEELAKRVPLSLFAGCKALSFEERRNKIESVLFWVSGLMAGNEESPKVKELQSQFEALAKESPEVKTIIPMKPEDWIFFRLRPSNFPTVRIAGLAELTSKLLVRGFYGEAKAIFDMKLPTRRKLKLLESLFSAESFGHWLKHVRFQQKEKESSKENDNLLPKSLIGKTRSAEIILNIILPALYKGYEGDEKACQEVHELYRAYPKTLSSELARNTATAILGEGYTIKSAAFEQGILELRKNYCKPFRCLECNIGQAIFSEKEDSNPNVFE